MQLKRTDKPVQSQNSSALNQGFIKIETNITLQFKKQFRNFKKSLLILDVILAQLHYIVKLILKSQNSVNVRYLFLNRLAQFTFLIITAAINLIQAEIL